MFLLTKDRSETINLDRFDLIRAAGANVVAVQGVCSIRIAECKTETDALLLQRAISDAWISPQQPAFDVDSWIFRKEHNLK